jgi:hypothetical protein
MANWEGRRQKRSGLIEVLCGNFPAGAKQNKVRMKNVSLLTD